MRLPLKWKKQCNYVDLSSCMKGPFASFICFVSYVKSIVMKTGIRIWLFRSVFFPIQPPSRKTDKTHTYQFNWLETCFFLLILFLKCEKQKKTFFLTFNNWWWRTYLATKWFQRQSWRASSNYCGPFWRFGAVFVPFEKLKKKDYRILFKKLKPFPSIYLIRNFPSFFQITIFCCDQYVSTFQQGKKLLVHAIYAYDQMTKIVCFLCYVNRILLRCNGSSSP